jgi:hypothetical protein
VEIGVLVVRDDELDVGDDEVASSEVAEVGERELRDTGKLWGTRIRLAGPGFPGMGGLIFED